MKVVKKEGVTFVGMVVLSGPALYSPVMTPNPPRVTDLTAHPWPCFHYQVKILKLTPVLVCPKALVRIHNLFQSNKCFDKMFS